MTRLFLLFTLTPILELWLLIELGGSIGTLPTVALVLATGFAGAYLARREGSRAAVQLNTALARGEMPTAALFDGACIFAGGALLLTPGVLTDVVGLLLLLPPSRALVQGWLTRWAQQKIAASATVRTQTVVVDVEEPPSPPGDPRIIDQVLDEKKR